MILHAQPGVTYTSDVTGYCGRSTLTSCENAVTTAPAGPDSTRVFFVYCVFPPDSTPSIKGVAFGIEYDPERLVLVDHGSCAGLEAPTPGWPNSGAGTSVVWDSPQTGSLIETYWFAGYSADVSDTTSFALTPHPIEGGHFADSSIPAVLDSIAGYGRLGFGASGAAPCPGSGAPGPDGPGGNGSGGDSEEEEPAEEDPHWSMANQGSTFVEMATASDSAFAAGYEGLTRDYGLDVVLGMGPDGLVCRMDDSLRAALSGDLRVNIVTTEIIASAGSATPGEPGFAARVWNEMLTLEDPAFGEEAFRDSLIGEPDPITGVLAPWDDPERQTSVYLLGRGGVSVVLMESEASSTCPEANSAENWTDTEISGTMSRVWAGLIALWNLRPNSYISVRVDPWYRVPTSIEPIHDIMNPLWRQEALSHLGTSSEAAFNNERRSEVRPATDAWYTIFLIDDSCDADHAFDGYEGLAGFAIAFGPSATLPAWISEPDSEQVGRDRVMPVTLHETCHVFGAGDESVGGCADCADRYGYLRVQNRNCKECQPNCPDECVDPPLVCSMDDGFLWPPILCEYSSGQIGWRDSDGDGIDDPIDHPDAHRFMRIGVEEPLQRGDYVDIYGLPFPQWLKRLPASDWNLDQGQILWDGVYYDGTTTPAQYEYGWTKNGGAEYHDVGDLVTDAEPPVVQVEIHDGPSPLYVDTLLVRFTDADTHGGRIRATATSMSAPPGLPKVVLADSFYVETGSSSVIKQPIRLRKDVYNMTVRIWAVGHGLEAVTEVPFLIGSGVDDRRPPVAGPAVSPARPNPSSGTIMWSLDQKLGGPINLSVVGVDGRTIKRWSERALPEGTTRIRWDGLDAAGRRVAAGRYYLVVTNASGEKVARAATIIR